MADKRFRVGVFETKVLDEQNRIIEMIGSTEDFDRVGDRMFMSGVILANYLKNPIILPNHDYQSQAIGRAIDVKVSGSNLVFKIQFADTELGREWYYLYANKFMNASSIGFIGLEYKPNDHGGYDFTKWELLELSLVTVPCNPNAIQRAYSEGRISKALFDSIQNNKNEEVIENMTIEEVKSLIESSVNEKVKSLQADHAKELQKKVKEIENLNAKIKDLEAQIGGKSGAKLSKSTCDTLTKACEGMTGHIKSIQDLITNVVESGQDDGDNDGEEAKDYSEEEIQKMIQENIEKIIKEAN